jgi:signal transduction histidine kinase/CheY-like chemotaxis protein/HPt (histidine-containing phosphotransfer) domain-containing protein
VYAIHGDADNNLWLSTTGGITRFNLDEGITKHYSVKDGLVSNDFNLGASYMDDNGWLYFGSSNGFNAFLPENIQERSLEPPVVLTRVVQNNEDRRFDYPYSELSSIELTHNDYMVGFEFAALDYNAPDKNRYRYQMVGLNRSWVDLDNKAAVDFTNLTTGNYVFRVAASNADGVWNESGFTVSISVSPPPWMTWWAFFLYIASALLVVMVVLERQRQRERLQLQYQSQLESDVRARTRDLKRANENLHTAVEEAGAARRDAIQANQAKSEFLAALSHEIRTPMHGVLGMTDLLLHSGLSERQTGFANSAHESANELLSLIDNILDFSKIEAGRLELEETTFNLREVTESLCYLYGEMAQTKGVDLNLIFRANLRRQVFGDPVRLRQILQNLLSNAIKFTKRGSVDVTVEVLSHEDKATRVRFTVEDTGIGMDEVTQERVFEAFSQADSSTTRQFGGTGLGLSIAKQLIELMEGTLDVSSTPGVGTRMMVTLSLTESPIYVDKLSVAPLEGFYAQVVAASSETRAMLSSQMELLSLQAQEFSSVEEIPVRAENQRLVLVDVGTLYDNPSIAQIQNLAEDELSTVLLVSPLSMEGIPAELAHLPHTEKPCRTAELMSDITAALSPQVIEQDTRTQPAVLRYDQRVLVVEDMSANQEIARAMLESFGCSVEIAKNGAVALEMYQQESYDIILMDCQMPVMDGFEATRHIRRLEAQLPGNVRTPIIAVTAGKTEVEKDRCFASGMDRILFKPYSTAELNNVLANYFAPSGKIEAVQVDTAIEHPRQERVSDVLDMKALDNIRSVELHTGNNLLAKVFENFKHDTEAKIEEMRANSTDSAALGSGAHAIKSMSLNIGAKSLSEYCRQREVAWKNDELENVERELEVLYGHFLDAVSALEPIVTETVIAD